MKEVLAFIEKKKQYFSQLRLFKYLQNKSIDPKQRLAWAPCLTPFAMSFGQLNKYDFRKEPTDDPIQELINKHTYEDDDHWEWFLEDLEKLGLNHFMKFSDAMRFFWGEETYKTRLIYHQIALYTFKAEPVVVLAALEAIEATGNVALSLTAKVVQELQETTNQSYPYFGRYHLCVEADHTIKNDNIRQFMEKIKLTENQKIQIFEVVEKVFEVFTEAVEEMMTYAEKHPIKEQ